MTETKLKMMFSCCRCHHRYNMAEGVIPASQLQGEIGSEFILALNERNIPYFPIKCPKCGVVHILVIFGLPWNESIKEKTT